MSAVDSGGPAFQVPEHQDNWGTSHVTAGGMTLRDYFAAKAMAALIAEPQWGVGSSAVVSELAGSTPLNVSDRYANAAYQLADAMLKARQA